MAVSVGEVEATLRLRDDMSAQLRTATAALSGTGSAMSALSGQAGQTAASTAALRKQIESSKATIEELTVATKTWGGAALPAVQQELVKATADLAQLEAQLKATTEAEKSATAAAKGQAETTSTSTAATRTATAASEKHADATKALGQQIRDLGTGLTHIGALWTGAFTVPIVAAGAAAVHFGTDFETEMVRVQTLAGASGAEVASLRQHVLDLGPAVGVGAGELAKGLFVVETEGYRGAEAMRILEIAGKGVALGLGSTYDVTRTLVTTMKAFQQQGLSAADAMDVLVATVQQGDIPITALTGSLGRVSAIAAALGIPFAEVGASIATFTRVGVSADLAVTGLRAVLMGLETPTSKAGEAIKSLYGSVDNLRKIIAEKGLAAALVDMIEKTHGNVEALHELFPNVRALADALSNAKSQGQDYLAVTDRITHSHGVMEAGFKATGETLAQKWNEIKAGAENVAIRLSDALIPRIKELLPALQSVGELAMKAADFFAKLPAPVQEFAIAVLAVTAAIGPLLILLGQMAFGVGAITKLFAEGAIGMVAYEAASAKAAQAMVGIRNTMTGAGAAAGSSSLLVGAFSAAVSGIVIGAALVQVVEMLRQAKGLLDDIGARGADAANQAAIGMRMLAEASRVAGHAITDPNAALKILRDNAINLRADHLPGLAGAMSGATITIKGFGAATTEAAKGADDIARGMAAARARAAEYATDMAKLAPVLATVRKEHEDGVSIDKLAHEFGVAEATLDKYFKTVSVGAKGPTAELAKKLSEMDVEMRKAIASGMDAQSMAEQFGPALQSLGRQAEATGAKVGDSFAEAAKRVRDFQLGKVVADAAIEMEKAQAAAFDKMANDATKLVKDQGDKFKSMGKQAEHYRDMTVAISETGLDRQMADLTKKQHDEVRLLGDIPAVYERNYADAVDLINKQYAAKTRVLGDEQAKEIAKLGAVPPAYDAAYSAAVGAVARKYAAKNIAQETAQASEIANLGPLPAAYAAAYQAATGQAATYFGLLRDIAAGSASTIEIRMARAGVNTVEAMHTTADAAMRDFEQMRATGKYTAEQLATAFVEANRKIAAANGQSADSLKAIAAGLEQLASAVGGKAGGIISSIAGITNALAAARQANIDWNGDASKGFGIANALFSANSTNAQKWASALASGTAIVSGAMNVWASTAADATKKAGAFHGALAGAKAGAVFGPYGMAVGAAAGAVLGFVHTLTAGRRAVEDFAQSFDTVAKGSGFDEMHAKLLALGAAGEALWVKLTQGVGRGSPEQAKRVIDEIKAALAGAAAAVDEFGISWADMGAAVQQAHVAEVAAHLATAFASLTGQGVASETAIRHMSDALNQLLHDALTTGQGIPPAMGPIIEQLIRMGGLTEENARLMLGLGADTVPTMADIKDAADRYGISLDALGPKVKQLGINETAAQIVKDFELLIRAGGDTTAVLGGMAGAVQKLVTDALRLGLTLPESMRPIIQQMIDAGLLTDEFGDKLMDTSRLNFVKPLTDAIDELIQKLNELIDKWNHVGHAADDATRPRNGAPPTGTAGPREPTDPGDRAPSAFRAPSVVGLDKMRAALDAIDVGGIIAQSLAFPASSDGASARTPLVSSAVTTAAGGGGDDRPIDVHVTLEVGGEAFDSRVVRVARADAARGGLKPRDNSGRTY